MANTSSAKKAIRVSAKKTSINARRKKAFKAARKAVLDAIKSSDKKEAKALMPKAQKEIDKAVKSNIITKNTAARYKSRLVSKIKALGGK